MLDGNWEKEWDFNTHQPKVKKIIPTGVCCLLVEVELEVGLPCGWWLLDNKKSLQNVWQWVNDNEWQA